MVVTENVPAVPTVKAVLFALVIGGGLVDREGEGLRGVGRDPFAAVMVSE